MSGSECLSQEQKERIQKEFKIPVDSFNPGTYWIVSLDYESEMPTDEELKQIKSYCEFIVKKIYNETYQRKILEERELPSDAGHNTTIFKKRPSNHGWCYRKMTWEMGPLFFPDFGDKPVSLVEVMDRARNIIPEEWENWKKKHPEIFPAKEKTA